MLLVSQHTQPHSGPSTLLAKSVSCYSWAGEAGLAFPSLLHGVPQESCWMGSLLPCHSFTTGACVNTGPLLSAFLGLLTTDTWKWTFHRVWHLHPRASMQLSSTARQISLGFSITFSDSRLKWLQILSLWLWDIHPNASLLSCPFTSQRH